MQGVSPAFRNPTSGDRMPICPFCHSHIPLSSTSLSSTSLGSSEPEGACPQCGETAEVDSGYRDIARIVNLAEAGYLVSRLADEQIDAELAMHQSFDAVTGAWSPTYVLQVPAGDYPNAKALISDEASEANYEDSQYGGRDTDDPDEPLHLVFWRPVALMAVAGLATLWVSGRVVEHRQRAAPQRGDQALGVAVDAIGQPFTVQTDTGRVVHRLRYAKANQTWLLESDTNGDGKMDRLNRFATQPRAMQD